MPRPHGRTTCRAAARCWLDPCSRKLSRLVREHARTSESDSVNRMTDAVYALRTEWFKGQGRCRGRAKLQRRRFRGEGWRPLGLLPLWEKVAGPQRSGGAVG